MKLSAIFSGLVLLAAVGCSNSSRETNGTTDTGGRGGSTTDTAMSRDTNSTTDTQGARDTGGTAGSTTAGTSGTTSGATTGSATGTSNTGSESVNTTSSSAHQTGTLRDANRAKANPSSSPSK